MDDAERTAKTEALALCRAKGEKAYDDMYEAHSFRDASDCYRDAKDFFEEAIALAGLLGLSDEKSSLQQRLEHIRAVFRKQFVQ
jgi:hypothetical protein